MTDRNLKTMYDESFDPNCYFNSYNKKLMSWHYFFLRNVHEVFSDGRVRGKTCIEIGAGPTVYTLASASNFCDALYTSDFVKGNRDQLNLWMKNDPNAFDWSLHFKLVAEIEGNRNNDEGCSKIQSRLRSKLNDVLFCDATKEYPLEKMFQPFDVVITSACLESATLNDKDYASAVRNLSNLLQSGGKLIMMGFLNSSWYMVNGTKFPAIVLTDGLIKNTLKDVGFTIDVYKEDDVTDCDEAESNRSFFCLSTKD